MLSQTISRVKLDMKNLQQDFIDILNVLSNGTIKMFVAIVL
jgi:hypothetical protein